MYANVPGAAVAAFATFMLGAPWYSKSMFLNTWARERGISYDSKKPRTRSKSKVSRVILCSQNLLCTLQSAFFKT